METSQYLQTQAGFVLGKISAIPFRFKTYWAPELGLNVLVSARNRNSGLPDNFVFVF
jgi:hypothetical protein